MVTEEQVYEVLRDVYDPEIPVNIVDLGLIYEVKINNDWVGIKMTLTAPGCPVSVYLAQQVRERLLTIPEVKDADVRIVWEPLWNPSMMSDEAKKLLGWGL
ncbi:MAG: metal-sulfur cluster assembly factor [Bacteroidota bacterium]